MNGICLGLAGKPNVLGRSTNLTDFIKVGADKAAIEVELFNPDADEENVVIIRNIDRAAKSLWWINGKKSGVREVEKKVAKFRIQVDNLCQFLPQDKVHDFSRLSSKGLLDSTVDAVGDVSLKQQHAQLKELQKNMSEGEELFERKQQMLVDQTEKCRKLEEEVKAFEEKRKIESKITVAEGRLAWSKFYDKGRIWSETRKSFEESKKKYEKQDEKLEPLKTDIENLKKKRANLETKHQAFMTSVRNSTKKAKTHSQNIERLDEQVEKIDEEIDELEQIEDAKKDEIKRLETVIAEMEGELSSTQDEEDLGPLCAEARRKTEDLLARQSGKMIELNNLKYERTNLSRSISDRQEEMRKLNDVEKMKLRKLRELNDDTENATHWLRNNKNMFHNDVFEPFVMCANVHDVQFSKYLENSINQRDMTAFFFETAEDMNQFLDIVRNQKGWRKVSGVVLPDRDLQDFQPNIPESNLRRLGFVSYLKNLVSAPDKVMAFMCNNYGLHRIPVFKEESEKFEQIISNELGFTKYFVGSKVQTISGSDYSSVKSTMTREVFSNRYLEITKDEDRERHIRTEMSNVEDRLRKIEVDIKAVQGQYESINLELEKARQDQKALEQRKNFKARQGALIEQQRKILRQKLSVVGNDRTREEKIVKKKSLVLQQVKSVQLLQAAIGEASKVRIKIEISRLSIQPLEDLNHKKTEELGEAQDKIKDLKKEAERLETELHAAEDVLKNAQREAINITGRGKKSGEPPEEVKQIWEAEKIPSRFEEIEVLINELRAKTECMDSVDPRIIREYNTLKENIEELQQDIERRQRNINEKMQTMTELKDAWMENLNRLISRINDNFSSHFASMGFAGEVSLSKGAHEDDFEHYGIKIKVKYRDNEPLQVNLS